MIKSRINKPKYEGRSKARNFVVIPNEIYLMRVPKKMSGGKGCPISQVLIQEILKSCGIGTRFVHRYYYINLYLKQNVGS